MPRRFVAAAPRRVRAEIRYRRMLPKAIGGGHVYAMATDVPQRDGPREDRDGSPRGLGATVEAALRAREEGDEDRFRALVLQLSEKELHTWFQDAIRESARSEQELLKLQADISQLLVWRQLFAEERADTRWRRGVAALSFVVALALLMWWSATVAGCAR